jgi:hypothetical protein
MQNEQSPTIVETPPQKRREGCPRCGGKVRTLNQPWVAFIAAPAVYLGGLRAAFAVGIVVGLAVLLWPVSCAKCGQIALRELGPRTRTIVVVKKIFVLLLVVVIAWSAYACLTALQAIQPQ